MTHTEFIAKMLADARVKRSEIESHFKVERGTIVSPGKFEGEPVWAPYYWEEVLNGLGETIDEDDGVSTLFEVSEEDKAAFPELAGFFHVLLWEDSQGFVRTDALRKAREV